MIWPSDVALLTSQEASLKSARGSQKACGHRRLHCFCFCYTPRSVDIVKSK